MIRSVEDAEALEVLTRSWRLSGLIVTGMFEDGFYDTTVRLDIPFVLIDSYINDPEVCCVGLEDEKGGYLATRHLLENGHRRIAFASPSIRPGGVIDKRFQGYRRALQEFGVAYDPALIFTQEMSVEDSRRLGRTLAEKETITVEP